MNVTLATRNILSSAKFQIRYAAPNVPTHYSIGYSYETNGAGVHLHLVETNTRKTMNIALTPEQAERMAAELIEWAGKTRQYQNENTQ